MREAIIQPSDETVCPFCKVEMVKDSLEYTCFHCGKNYDYKLSGVKEKKE